MPAWAAASVLTCGGLLAVATLAHWWGVEAPAARRLPGTGGAGSPVRPLLAAAAAVYAAIGVGTSAAAVRRVDGLRARAAWLVRAVGVAALLFLPPLLCAVWIVAAWTDAVPSGTWGVNEGNHGPWRRAPDLRGALELAFALPGVGLAAAAAALLIRPTRASLALAMASVASCGALGLSHYWLID